MNSYTVFTTYALVPTGITAGYIRAIHCNYINTMQLTTDNLAIQEIRVNFLDASEFKFLSTDIINETGYTVHRIYLIAQVVENISGTTTKPDPANWKYLDVTSQVSGYTGSGYLTPAQITSVVFKMPLNNYDSYSTYDLNYLNYPSFSQTNQLCFGDETYFFGNVTTDIKADVYTLDYSINLSLNEFNSSTNSTWDGVSRVYISEVGIYDANKNLVAIGKLNDPLPKDATIARTILFALDF
jgi:hypothetical protein